MSKRIFRGFKGLEELDYGQMSDKALIGLAKKMGVDYDAYVERIAFSDPLLSHRPELVAKLEEKRSEQSNSHLDFWSFFGYLSLQCTSCAFEFNYKLFPK